MNIIEKGLFKNPTPKYPAKKQLNISDKNILYYIFVYMSQQNKKKLSKTCEYGIKATLYESHQSQLNVRTSLKDISQAIDSPEAFTAKILQLLSRNGILKSTKGPSGGFEIPEENRKNIRLSDIVFAIDGNSLYLGCGLGLKECNSLQPCPLHDKFMKIRDDLKQMLETTSIEELSNGLNSGLSFLKR